jgi:purine-binding chemotaxis protein CheW
MQFASNEVLGERSSEELKCRKALEGKYLTFGLRNEEYGIDILKVKEIIGMMNITAIPQPPPMSRAS